MTFLHKLARRLAGVPALGVLVFAAASCGQGDAQDYLGPDPHTSSLISITISPRDPQIAFGDSVRFEANGWLSSGKSTSAQVIWSASGGTINSSGWFHPSAIGSYQVRATSTVKTSLSDSVHVLSYNLVGGIQRLMVLPSGIAVPKGASQQFTAQAVLNDGSIVSPTVTWSAVGGSITPSGLFTATSAGTAEVTATLGAGLATAASDIAIQPAILTQLMLDPSSTAMESGEARQFTVAASWSDGSSTVPPVIWRVEGGTLSSQNVYTAGSTPGTYHVIVTSPSFAKADTTTVIILPYLVSLVVTPDSARLAPGATQALQAYGLRNDGSQSAAGVQWTATGGTIGLNGTYTAGSTAGQYRAIATLHALNGQTFVDTAQIAIGAPSATLTQLSITPHSTSVSAGSPLQFSVSGHWSDGSTTTVPAVTWSATGGTIDASGLFTAGNTPGTYSVIARQTGGTRADTAQVSVVAKLTDFRVSPRVDTLFAGNSHQFSATLTWSDGQTHPVTISWTATGGAISSTGVYSPGSLVGSFLVIAACSCGASDTAAVTVLSPTPPASPNLTSLYVAPHSLALALGAVQQFSATGTWSDHSSGPVSVTYQATGGTISGSGFYVAGSVPGTYQVIATVQGGTKADTATITLSAGVILSSMALSPPNAALVPGGSQHFAVSGLLSDGSSTTPVVSYSATGGTIDSLGNYTAGTQAGTYQVIALQQGGSLVDTASITIGSPTQLVMTPATATVYPGTTRQFLVSGGNSLSFQATGGTITQAGLYTAGAVSGSYRVIVTSGTAADTSAVTIPALTSLALSPNPVTVGAGAGQLFSVTGHWSDGSTAAPLVSWNATGGTISPVGLYTAGSTTGTFRVIAQFSSGPQADTASVTISGLAPPPPSGGELVTYPSPEVGFIIGPQLRSGSSSNPWPWYDTNQLAKGLEHGAAFPANPPLPSTGQDDYINENYYDLALCLYTAYYRTGNPTLLAYARKVADSWWQLAPVISSGNNNDFENYNPSPRVISLGGLILRALDGRPEMWPWILKFVRYDYDMWLGNHLNDSQLYLGVRDGGYMLLYSAWLAKVYPDPAVRAEFYGKALNAAKSYYARLQRSDGSWRWVDSYEIPGYFQEPFMVGLLLDGMVATHRLTGDPQILNAITKSVENIYTYTYRGNEIVNEIPSLKWRGVYYIIWGDTCPTGCGKTVLDNGDANGVREVRQLNALLLHAYGYAYYATGDARYRTWGDEMFSATFGNGVGPGADASYGLADFRPKEYDQSYRSSGHYLVWRLGH